MYQQCFIQKLSVLWLLIMYTPVSCDFDNIPHFEVNCSYSGLQVQMTFTRMFKGVVYANGYSLDPICSSVSESGTQNMLLSLPLMDCGTYIQRIPGVKHPSIMNIILVQQHHILKTSNDYNKTIVCQLANVSENPEWLPLAAIKPLGLYVPEVKSWLELKLGSEIFDKQTSDLATSNKLFILFHVKDGGRHGDLLVTNCFAHNERIFTRSTSLDLLTNSSACSKSSTQHLSEFTVTKMDASDLVAYVELEDFITVASGHVFITCDAQLCEDICVCFHNQNPSYTIGNHNLVKRSTDYVEYKTRNRFLMSTIRALTERLMKNRNQTKQLKEENFSKRILPASDDSDFSGVTDFNKTHESVIGTTTLDQTTSANVETHVVQTNNYHQSLFEDHAESETTEPGIAVSPTVHTMPEVFQASNTTPIRKDVLKDKVAVHLDSSLNKTSEKIDLAENDSEPTANATTKDNSDHDCVPSLRFTIVTVVLGFIVICLLLACCGMALYIRKEKKNRRIDNFLLYNFY